MRGIGSVSERELLRSTVSPVNQSRVTARLIAAGLMYYNTAGTYSATLKGSKYIEKMDRERGRWL